MTHPLGRRAPPDWDHKNKYPLSAAPRAPYAAPVVMGTAWLTGMDAPVQRAGKRGKPEWWITATGDARGGHAYCLKPALTEDRPNWWTFYDQGREGACVGFASARMLSLFNRRKFDARWVWDRAKEVDVWPDTNPGDDNGTSVRAAMDVLRDKGALAWVNGKPGPVVPAIKANRWASTVDEVLAAVGTPELDYVTLLNSWGRSWPHYVRMSATDLELLLARDGEAAVPTDA